MKEIPIDVIAAYALENALKHSGKASQGPVLSGLFAEGLEKSHIKEYIPKIAQTIKEVNGLDIEAQREEFEKIKHLVSHREVREGLPPLPNAKKGSVVMRFAPFPSGPLHIGNARTLILNSTYAEQYKGKLLLVIDDTIGSEQKPIEPEAYKLIEQGIKELGIPFKGPIRKSDRMKIYYEHAEQLIERELLYICDCDRETMRKLKEEGVECACRAYPVDVQKKRWKEMFKAKEGTMTARLKTNMQDPDPAFRDRIMFRISQRPHARLGKKFRVYPLLDFSWAIDDHLLGVTHILRGNDLVMETKVEKFIWDIFGWSHPEVIYNGQFEIEGVKISKSKGAAEVKAGTYIGWNDPRTWSLQSLSERGITPKSITEFILEMNLTKANTKVPIETLYAINRKNLNDVSRYFFIANPKKISIKGSPSLNAKLPLHPSNTKGYRATATDTEFFISQEEYLNLENKNYRFMHLFNFKTENALEKKPAFTFISQEPDKKLQCSFLHWLPVNQENVSVEIRMPNNETITGLGEPNLKKLKKGTTIQFERFGFARLHKKEKEKLEFWFAHK